MFLNILELRVENYFFKRLIMWSESAEELFGSTKEFFGSAEVPSGRAKVPSGSAKVPS